MRKKSILSLAFAALATLLIGCALVPAMRELANPKPTGEEEEGPDREALVRKYNELIHRAAPGTDWRSIERANAFAIAEYKQSLRLSASKTAGAFAGGLITGNWYERGNNTTAGRMSGFAYNAGSNVLYGMSDAGTLWKTNPPTGTWTLLNDDYQLRSKVLAITTLSGSSTRIFTALDTAILYTDNGGTSFQGAAGITYPVAWGGNQISDIKVINDANRSVYALVQAWNSSPWAKSVQLYQSTDSGKNFSKIFTFPTYGDDQVSLFSPYNTGQLYALAVTSSGADSLYSITGNTVSLLNRTTAFPNSASKSLLTGLMNGSTLQLYAMVDDAQIFSSTNNGATWTSVSTVNPTSSHLFSSSTKVVGNVFYGAVEAYRSTNGGISFTKINPWGDYYANPAAKLHADIQAINFFQNSSGAEFCIIGTDGGAYYSNDYLATVSNISLTGLRVNQLWHHVTDATNPSVFFSGMQDQGLCHTNAASGTGIINQTQLISGDYGQMCITGGDVLWAEYPGGNMYLYSPTGTPLYRTTYALQGTQKSNAAWMMPTATIPGVADEILLGGGNITGGAGSYLAKLSYVNSAVNATQFSFNFRAASANGTSGLSSVAISGLKPSLWYAATEDGTFFWSNNSGTNWNKTTSFAGTAGFWLYGAAIAPSKKDKGTVYFGGSGYSNAGIFVSRDSGQTFTAMNTGLPQTLINGLAVSPQDSLIFAATDAGPYVYITKQAQWYPLIETTTPGCAWKNVEFLPSLKTARFSTYGRGVWDFVITGTATPPNSVASAGISEGAALYPNPSAAGGNIFIQGLFAKNASIAISDMLGHTVARLEWGGSGPLKVPNLPAGNYSYAIRQDGRLYRGKLTIY